MKKYEFFLFAVLGLEKRSKHWHSKVGKCGASGYHFTFLPPGTCKIIFTTDLYEFHTLCMTSCKDSLTSYIQHAAVRADDKVFHMSIYVITWGKRLWLIILMGPRIRQEHIRACCWLKYHVVMFFFLSFMIAARTFRFMSPSFYATDWCNMWK